MSASLIIALVTSQLVHAPASGTASQPAIRETGSSGCLVCHEGIEWIRAPDSGMMREILRWGQSLGDPAGCVVCHGGDPKAREASNAHGGEHFYPDPGSPWINENTCGPCHPRHTATQWNSLMMTESGKIQGTTWGFGALEKYEHRWGNYDAKNPPRSVAREGTPAYREYMEQKKQLAPGVYVDAQTTVPAAITDPALLSENPALAAFTYIRGECQRCHLAVRGRRGVRGDYRGMGCSACHIPYADAGLYEGNDPTIPKDEPGHMLVHMIQSTRKVEVTVGQVRYSGIPLKTCETCHNRGKRIGVSFQGLMESAYQSPFREGGQGQIKLHGKTYIAMHADIHGQRGMLCQDCHTSIDVHGDGFLAGTNLGQIEIECQDCHGTPRKFPWELPLGYGDECREQPADGPLLTARGNPLPEVVRRGNTVVVHTAGGKDLVLTPLKTQIASEDLHEPIAARVAMQQVQKHLDRMECYGCHGQWMPQCYGCHIRIDYRQGTESFDWVAAGHRHTLPEHRTDNLETGYPTTMPGHVSEQRSYLRWEDPPLGVNGEGRICTVTTGCQTTVTLIGPGGNTLVRGHIFRTPPQTEGGGSEGQLAMDVSPGQPHTTGRARSCESCHNSPKALGYGIGHGKLSGPWDQPVYADLTTAEGRPIPASTVPQIEPIVGLRADWSRFVTEDGTQLMTVGHHWPLSRPLNNVERANMDREGVCLACHREIPTESVAVSLLHHVAEATGMLPRDNAAHSNLIHKNILLAAWVQVGGMVAGPVMVIAALWYVRRRRRIRRRPAD